MKTTKPIYQDSTRKDWIIGISILVIYVMAISLAAFLLLPEYWYWWLFLVIGGMILLVLNQTKNYACRCRDCGDEFEISFFTNLLSPHGVDKEGNWQWVKCPNCEKRTRVTVIKIAKE